MNMNYKVNPDYIPKQGDYLSVEDWAEDEIKWLASNTPEDWWYNADLRKEAGFHGRRYLKVCYSTYCTTNILYVTNRRITPDMLLIDTSPLLQPSPVPRKILVADCSKGLYDIVRGILTHNKPYQITTYFGDGYEVFCDDEVIRFFGKCWFKEVLLYDEDEDDLICRDIEFEEGDYIDLRKHSPEQIRHIAKFYPVFELEETLYRDEWDYLCFDYDKEFSADNYPDEFKVEYTYDDIFYKE